MSAADLYYGQQRAKGTSDIMMSDARVSLLTIVDNSKCCCHHPLLCNLFLATEPSSVHWKEARKLQRRAAMQEQGASGQVYKLMVNAPAWSNALQLPLVCTLAL